jgi:hypothetical protein
MTDEPEPTTYSHLLPSRILGWVISTRKIVEIGGSRRMSEFAGRSAEWHFMHQFRLCSVLSPFHSHFRYGNDVLHQLLA